MYPGTVQKLSIKYVFLKLRIKRDIKPHNEGERKTIGEPGPSTPIRSQNSIRNFLGKEVNI